MNNEQMKAPSESVDTPDWRRLVTAIKLTDLNGSGDARRENWFKAMSALIAATDSWGAARYEAGWQEMQAEADARLDKANEFLAAANELRARAERAEAALEEWRFTNKVDELGREVDRLRAALASRQAVDLSGLRCFDEAGFEADYEVFAQFYRIVDVDALLSGKVEDRTYQDSLQVAPTTQEIRVVAPTASADGLPPLPDPQCYPPNGSEPENFTANQMRVYAAQARADALEEAAQICEYHHVLRSNTGHPREASTARILAEKIRAVVNQKKGQ